MKKALGILVLVIIIAALAGISATIGWTPFFGPDARPLTDRRFDPTPERLARGEYLVNNVAQCLFCHSEYDSSVEGLPVKPETRGGGRSWASEGVPWLHVSNISPDAETGSGRWSDDAFARAVREGIGHDGRTLFPIMPYRNYQYMSDEDLAAIIVYLRSIPPVRRAAPPSEIPFPVNRMINMEPRRIDAPVPPPDVSTPAQRGMTDEDLKAIFGYLQTLPPVEHYVSNLDPVGLCPRCNIEHGGGVSNKPAAQ